MKLKYAPEPHYRTAESSRGIYADALIPLCMLLVIPFIYNGARVLTVTLASALTCVLCELLFCFFSKQPVGIGDLSAVITGVIIALMLPVTVPYYIIILAGAFAIFAAKMPFGGLGRNIFNPAAAGLCFVTVCFSQEVFKFRDTKLLGTVSIFKTGEFATAASPALSLSKGVQPDILTSEMLLGNFPGAMGTTAALVIAACFLYMLMRGTVKWQTPVCFVLTAAAIAFCFPRVGGSRTDSVVFELLSGSLLFCAVFMATDPVTSPKTAWGRAVYGVLCGTFTMLFRRCGAFEEGTVFVLLILNCTAPAIDRLVFAVKNYIKRGEANG